MTANELADGILAIEERIFLTKKEHQLFQNSATMLRQQQAEIDRLTMLCDCMTTESNRKGNEIEALKSRELTDEEILNIAHQIRLIDRQTADDGHLYFARAILRKAQENDNR